MTAALKVDLNDFKRLAEAFADEEIKQALIRLPESKEIAALVGQAIAENFGLQGPGWMPLKGSTIRRSISKKIVNAIRKEVLNDLGIGSLKNAKSTGQLTQVNRAIDKKLERHEKKFGGTEFSNRQILRKTGLLMKSATSPNAPGNIWKREGSKLVWGTDLVYAAVHNYGYPARNIPKREFMVLRESWTKQLQELVLVKAIEIIRKKLGSE